MAREQSMSRFSSRLAIVACWCSFVALFVSACDARGPGGVNASTTVTVSPTSTAMPTATKTPAGDCPPINGDPINLTIPLPPNTISHNIGGGAAGATYYIECTPNTTQAALVASLNAGFQRAGWTRWDPTVDNAGGCGTQANSFWQWKNGQVTVGWTFRGASLPEWTIAVCSLAYATPQA
jgi:hypothetical protein